MPAAIAAMMKASPVDARHVEADGLRAHRAVAAGAQGVAERREDDGAQRQHGRRAQDQREIVVGDLAGRPRRRPHAQDAVVAAGQLDPLERHRPGDLREGQRQHGEIDARQPHAEPAEHDARQAGEKRREQQSCRHRRGEPLGQPAPRRRRRGRNRRHGRTRRGRPAPS